MATHHATIAILSIGQMGLGIASLLQAHNYRIITNISDRSQATQGRAKSAKIETFSTDEELVDQADYIFSIVPPRDAIATAHRIESAFAKGQRKKQLYYLELNAISPTTAKSIQTSFTNAAPTIHFIDGGIIGGPPALSSSTDEWTKPDIPLSGPYPLHDAPCSGAHLANVLNTKYLGDQIGSASGLKCCFAALSKGFTALALQSFSTASALGVYDALQEYLAVYNSAAGEQARKSVVGCTGKAYRWVEEMRQIGETFVNEGGWGEQAKVFREIAGVYQELADVVEKEGREGMKDAEGVANVLQRRLGSLKGTEQSDDR